MAAENNLIFNNPFNINVNLPKKTIREIQKVAQEEAKKITVNPFLNYLEEYDSVFSGEISNELRKYQSQAYTLGQLVREGQPRSTFQITV